MLHGELKNSPGTEGCHLASLQGKLLLQELKEGGKLALLLLEIEGAGPVLAWNEFSRGRWGQTIELHAFAVSHPQHAFEGKRVFSKFRDRGPPSRLRRERF